MKTITLIVVHCSAVRPNQCIDYHYVIRRDGSIEQGRPEWQIGAHCVNHNAHSIGICYEGGLNIRGQPADTCSRNKRKEAFLSS
jgi:N-acetyl-anhydromuramyl-L-alanine amidase AmpD